MRPKRVRRVSAPPPFAAFAPVVREQAVSSCIWLHWDEFEALRLVDYEDLDQARAAEKLGVSRATAGRILRSARRKLAQTLVESSCLCVDEGPVHLDRTWLRCRNCGLSQEREAGESQRVSCPDCGKDSLRLILGKSKLKEVE